MRPTHLNTPYKYDLSPRQREVLELVSRGLTNAEIAERLGITLDGAKYHVREILGKLGVDSREEAAAAWGRMHSPAARLHSAWLAMLGSTVWRFVAASAAAAVVAGTAILVYAAFDGGSGDEPGPTAPPEATSPSLPTTGPTTAALAHCTSTQVKLALEFVPEGNTTLIRLSANGTEACQLLGPAWLHIIRPPADPGSQLPPHAGLDRTFKVALNFPFSGVLGEWTWANWCAPASLHIWEARAGDQSDYALVQRSVDAFPPCSDASLPTTVFTRSLTTGVDGDNFPLSKCPANVQAWLCQFASSVAMRVAAGDVAGIVRTGIPTTYTCAENGSVVGMEFTNLCAGKAPGDTAQGLPLTLHGSHGGPVSVDELATRLSAILPPMSSGARWYLGAIACSDSSPACQSFIVAFATRSQPAVAYMTFQLTPGHEPALIGAGLSGDNAETILTGGPTTTGLGNTTFIPFPPRG